MVVAPEQKALSPGETGASQEVAPLAVAPTEQPSRASGMAESQVETQGVAEATPFATVAPAPQVAPHPPIPSEAPGRSPSAWFVVEVVLALILVGLLVFRWWQGRR